MITSSISAGAQRRQLVGDRARAIPQESWPQAMRSADDTHSQATARPDRSTGRLRSTGGTDSSTATRSGPRAVRRAARADSRAAPPGRGVRCNGNPRLRRPGAAAVLAHRIQILSQRPGRTGALEPALAVAEDTVGGRSY